MIKFVIKLEDKGWFQAFGLHHAALTILLISLGHFISVGTGSFLAVFAVGWYASREYGGGLYPPATFEVLDVVSPSIVAALYLIFF